MTVGIVGLGLIGGSFAKCYSEAGWQVLACDIDKATFGKMIEYFKQFATLESNREPILSHLKKFNTKRNQVVHDLFDIKDLNRLAEELDDYADLADEILRLLVEYENEVCENLCALANRVNFKKYL